MSEKKRSSGLSDEQVEAFEQRLHTSLYPVDPNRQFVDQLRNRLTNPSTVTVERDNEVAARIAIVGFVLTFISVMLLLGIRLLRILEKK
ncbi:MAG TPA: hypothetical protein VHO48_06905 [Anaerolineaceae bacterium]|nr:hypothetical protein [Anaerolineaceae bacterium]